MSEHLNKKLLPLNAGAYINILNTKPVGQKCHLARTLNVDMNTSDKVQIQTVSTRYSFNM